MKSPAMAIVVTSILFGLGHWPGLYLRGGPGVDGWSADPIQVAAFTIARSRLCRLRSVCCGRAAGACCWSSCPRRDRRAAQRGDFIRIWS